MIDPSTLKSTSLLLRPTCWKQSVHTHLALAMRVDAEASKRGGGRFTVPGLGNILELPFGVDFIRGAADWELADQPPGAVGFLACYENRAEEFGLQRTMIGGGIALPEAIFDDIWERVRLAPVLQSTISLEIGPVRPHGAEDMIWDRAKDKVLFVTQAGVSFIRDLEMLPGQH